MWLLTRENPDEDSAPLLFDSAETLALYLENGKSELYNIQWIPVWTPAQSKPKEELPELRIKAERFSYLGPLSGESE